MNFIILASYSQSILNFRKELILEIQKRGFNIIIIAPNISESHELLKFIDENNMSFYDMDINRSSKNIIMEALCIGRLIYLFFKTSPVGVLSYTIKPNLYGMLVAWFFRIPMRFSIVTGLGYLFRSESKSFMVKTIQQIYGFALRKANIIFFQNSDDKNTLLNLGVISHQSNAICVNGSGVNTQKFLYTPLPVEQDISFLMIGRLLVAKGVIEFFSASIEINNLYPNIKFYILGWEDDGPDSISPEDIALIKSSTHLKLLDKVNDVRPIIKNSHVFVLPSYHEGLPRAVIEAMAIGRPIITTDAPGCRDTVVNSFNGYIVEKKNVSQLVNKMEFFIKHPDQIEVMGRNSRELVVEKFDVIKVNKTMMDAMEIFFIN